MSAGGSGGDWNLDFFGGRLSGDEGGVGGLLVTGDGCVVAVFCVRSCLMCGLVVAGMVCVGGGVASFSWQGVGGRRAGVDLIVVVGRRARASWRGLSPAGDVGRLLLSAPFLSKCWLVDFRKVTSLLT